jgi:hypothetical protein
MPPYRDTYPARGCNTVERVDVEARRASTRGTEVECEGRTRSRSRAPASKRPKSSALSTHDTTALRPTKESTHGTKTHRARHANSAPIRQAVREVGAKEQYDKAAPSRQRPVSPMRQIAPKHPLTRPRIASTQSANTTRPPEASGAGCLARYLAALSPYTPISSLPQYRHHYALDPVSTTEQDGR